MMNFIPGPFLTYLYLLSLNISALFYEKFSGVFKNTFHWQSSKLYNFGTFSETAQVFSHPHMPHASVNKWTACTGSFPLSFLHFKVLAHKFIFSQQQLEILSWQLSASIRIFKITIQRSLILSGLNNLVQYFCEYDSQSFVLILVSEFFNIRTS